jgi:transposase-like protein
MADKNGRQKRYGEEFRLQAAKLIVEGGYSYHRASEQLGVSDWALRCWVKAFRESGHLPPNGTDACAVRDRRERLYRQAPVPVRLTLRAGSARIARGLDHSMVQGNHSLLCETLRRLVKQRGLPLPTGAVPENLPRHRWSFL